ncbi:glycosyltransferase family 4 protein [Legionella impletisoli]|nr:glycosyltransferase family 4 protein [Legionella impletisoli]
MTESENKNGGKKQFFSLFIDLEPTPYKTDAWNTFAASSELDLFVIYTERKNWSPDGGHNYLKWPTKKFKNLILNGRGFWGQIQAIIVVVRHIFSKKPDMVYIAGYNKPVTSIAIIYSIFRRQKFVICTDVFNVDLPRGKFSYLKLAFRSLLRKLVFTYSVGVLVCGARGIESAVLAGCPKEKIIDFPYSVDVERLKSDEPESIPVECFNDKKQNKKIIFFSGRMIQRKGLSTLLDALAQLKQNNTWVLWIEGDGPLINDYKLQASELDISEKIRFLGFCQYDLHSWLIREADIVVVPSLEDPWGIVVDEGIQLEKVVVVSDAVGSGRDRIIDGQNGYLFPAGNSSVLYDLLNKLTKGADPKDFGNQATKVKLKTVTPKDNLSKFLQLLKTDAMKV